MKIRNCQQNYRKRNEFYPKIQNLIDEKKSFFVLFMNFFCLLIFDGGSNVACRTE